MHPTKDQIQFAAYERWLNRGGGHGHDRSDWLRAERELRFGLNYQTVAEYRLEPGSTRVLGNRRIRACRLCERGADEVSFDDPSPAIPGARCGGQLLTAEVCSECRLECLQPLADEFQQFRDGHTGLTLGAYKALIASSLLIMPARELAYFPDTIEWVNNPDPTCDAGLFAGLSCRAYSVPTGKTPPWVSLARRVSDEAAVPYTVFFLNDAGLLLQADVPLSLRDEDLNGVELASPQRSWIWSEDVGDPDAECRKIPVEIPGLKNWARIPSLFLQSQQPALGGRGRYSAPGSAA